MQSLLNKGLVIMVIASLIACNEDNNENPGPQETEVYVEIVRDLTLVENTGDTTLSFKLSHPAPEDGFALIELTTQASDFFATAPEAVDGIIEVAFSKGDTEAFITFTPVDDDIVNEDRIATFTIKEVSDPLLIGTKKSASVTVTSEDENGEPNPAQKVLANFEEATTILMENGGQKTIVVNFNEPLTADGSISINIESSNHTQVFTTTPEMGTFGTLMIPVSTGFTEVSFSIEMNNDELFLPHDSLDLHISVVNGAIEIGTNYSHKVKLLDNELYGKPRSFSTSGGGWTSGKTYEYNIYGRVQKVHWVTETPFRRSGTETYFYADNGLIERINHYPDIDEYFYQENGRIVRSEEINHGEKRSYKLYDYDQAGNVGAVADFHIQPSGEFAPGFTWIYLYYNDNNLYKQLAYSQVVGSEEYNLVSERSYENYSQNLNPFPIEVIPGISAQKNLPAFHTMQQNETVIHYTFAYSFTENDQLEWRSVSSSYGGEFTTYTYY